MARFKKAPVEVEEKMEVVVEAPVIPTTIEKISIDYGREDLNNVARKINEIIDHLNAQEDRTKDA